MEKKVTLHRRVTSISSRTAWWLRAPTVRDAMTALKGRDALLALYAIKEELHQKVKYAHTLPVAAQKMLASTEQMVYHYCDKYNITEDDMNPGE